MVGQANAGQQEQARRADAAGRDQNLALAAHDGGRTALLVISTPTARPASAATRITMAPVRMVRFGRWHWFEVGATAEDRRALRTVTW